MDIKDYVREELLSEKPLGGTIFLDLPRTPKPTGNKEKIHKDIIKLWDTFLSDATKRGYTTPKGAKNKSIDLHSKKFSPNDVTGRISLKVKK